MSKLSIAGVVFISLGIVSGLIQNIFYGYVDSDGILRDSLFLPFAFIFFGRRADSSHSEHPEDYCED